MTKRFHVPNISCNHCVMTITRELDRVPGVKVVQGDVATKTIVVEYESDAALAAAKRKLEEIGYPATE
ncbi:MAG: heavy-metal-associated domain-containing protein [Chloroflexi bacterium]|nr:heavy-metal-associated domain-containing protein [Chloroflexota bacterium]